jgi:hypothetical protein
MNCIHKIFDGEAGVTYCGATVKVINDGDGEIDTFACDLYRKEKVVVVRVLDESDGEIF